MSVVYSQFMQDQITAGYTFGTEPMGLVLLYASAAVGALTPNDLAGLLDYPGFQEVSGPPNTGTACPTYVRYIQSVNGAPDPNNAAIIRVIFGTDWEPIPVADPADPLATDEPVYVAAGLWYVVGAVGGVTDPWVMITDDPFGAVVSPGARITNETKTLFSYALGPPLSIADAPLFRSPGTQEWESARLQHVYLVPQRVNWLPNPSFENADPCWGWRSNGAMSRILGGFDGRYYGATEGTVMESLPVSRRGQVWRMSCHVRAAAGPVAGFPATRFNMGLVMLEDTYEGVDTQWARRDGDWWTLYPDWLRVDALFKPMDDVAGFIPRFEADGPFDLDMCLLEDSSAINPYWDGDSQTGMPGDFTWQGLESQSWSFWYNNRGITAARLFGEYVEGQVKLPALVGDWIPTGCSVATHWNVISQYDTRHPLKNWALGSTPDMPAP